MFKNIKPSFLSERAVFALANGKMSTLNIGWREYLNN